MDILFYITYCTSHGRFTIYQDRNKQETHKDESILEESVTLTAGSQQMTKQANLQSTSTSSLETRYSTALNLHCIYPMTHMLKAGP